MSGRLYLFAAEMEQDAASPGGFARNIAYGCCGIGLVDAAIGAGELIRRHEPDEIAFLGSCGAYPDKSLVVGDIVMAASVRVGSGEIADGIVRIPTLQSSSMECVPLEGYALPIVDVVCTLGVTEDDALAQSLARLGDVENMELFAVCRAAGSIPVSALLGVTNLVGAEGGMQWRRNYQRVMGAVGEVVGF